MPPLRSSTVSGCLAAVDGPAKACVAPSPPLGATRDRPLLTPPNPDRRHTEGTSPMLRRALAALAASALVLTITLAATATSASAATLAAGYAADPVIYKTENVCFLFNDGIVYDRATGGTWVQYGRALPDGPHVCGTTVLFGSSWKLTFVVWYWRASDNAWAVYPCANTATPTFTDWRSGSLWCGLMFPGTRVILWAFRSDPLGGSTAVASREGVTQ